MYVNFWLQLNLPLCGKHDATLDINMSVNIHSESLTFQQISLQYVTQTIKKSAESLLILIENKTKKHKLYTL